MAADVGILKMIMAGPVKLMVNAVPLFLQIMFKGSTDAAVNSGSQNAKSALERSTDCEAISMWLMALIAMIVSSPGCNG